MRSGKLAYSDNLGNSEKGHCNQMASYCVTVFTFLTLRCLSLGQDATRHSIWRAHRSATPRPSGWSSGCGRSSGSVVVSPPPVSSRLTHALSENGRSWELLAKVFHADLTDQEQVNWKWSLMSHGQDFGTGHNFGTG